MRSEEFKGKMLELKRCQDQYNELKGKLDDMRFKRKALFESGFRSIASKLREIYQVP
jgi:chromosome segregation ATPase